MLTLTLFCTLFALIEKSLILLSSATLWNSLPRETKCAINVGHYLILLLCKWPPTAPDSPPQPPTAPHSPPQPPTAPHSPHSPPQPQQRRFVSHF